MKNFFLPIVFALFLLGIIVYVGSKPDQSQSKEEANNQISQNQVIGMPTQGNQSSNITLTEFSDFQCPACAAWNQVVEELVKEFGGDIKFQYRHFPLNIHKNASVAAYAAEAAGLQDKFWPMANLLFTRQTEWSESLQPQNQFQNYATELGLNLDNFNQDFQSQEVKTKVSTDLKAAEKLNLSSTPSFLINGQLLKIFPEKNNPNENINPVEELRNKIEEAIDAEKN